MKPEVTLKYLSYLRNKKNGEEGFTLIELLVVVIIIGVLAAVALPNLLGQVGKARETSAKNAMGGLNRAQQAYHFEKGTFSLNLGNTNLQVNNALGVTIAEDKYYDFAVTGGSTVFAGATAIGQDQGGATDSGAAQGTRDFMSVIEYSAAGGVYGDIICQADVSGTVAATGIAAGVVRLGTTAGTGCLAGDTEIE